MTRPFTILLASASIGLAASVLAPPESADAQVRAAGRTSVGTHGGGDRAAAGANRRQGSPGRGGISNSGNRNNIENSRNNTNIDRSRNTNINTGDINIDTDGRYGWDNGYHPVARGVAFGTAAAVSAAVVGSIIYTLPPACSPYRGSYYYCGGVYYAPQYRGDTVVYVVVAQP